MARRKRRTVGPGLAGQALEDAVWALAAVDPTLVAVEWTGSDGRRRLSPIVRHAPVPRRAGRYGDLDAGQVLRTWTDALERLRQRGLRQPTVPQVALEIGVDRSTAYRWRKRYGLGLGKAA